MLTGATGRRAWAAATTPACLLAVGVDAVGNREILGVDLGTTQDGAGWFSFFCFLVARGLTGTQLIISDDRTGLVDAVAAVLRGASWQRCRTHYLKNLLTKVPKSSQTMATAMVRTIFTQPTPDQIQAQHRRVVDHLRHLGLVDAADHLDGAATDLLVFRGFPDGPIAGLQIEQITIPPTIRLDEG